MKAILFSYLLLFSMQLSGQNYRMHSNAGTIMLNENYINILPIGVQKIIRIEKITNLDDVYSFRWIVERSYYQFKVKPPTKFVYLIKYDRITNKEIDRYMVRRFLPQIDKF